MEARLLCVVLKAENPLREVSGQGPRRERMLTCTLKGRRHVGERQIGINPAAAGGTTERQTGQGRVGSLPGAW